HDEPVSRYLLQLAGPDRLRNSGEANLLSDQRTNVAASVWGGGYVPLRRLRFRGLRFLCGRQVAVRLSRDLNPVGHEPLHNSTIGVAVEKLQRDVSVSGCQRYRAHCNGTLAQRPRTP